MSRENRRRNASRPLTAPPTPRPEPRRPVSGAPGASDAQRHIVWRACLVGLLAGEAVLLVLSDGGLALANFAFGTAGRIDGGIVGVASLVGTVAGGFVAARMAGRWGVWQGMVTAIGFILVGVVVQFAQEAQIVHSALADGRHSLVDLGPMSIPNVISGDFLALFGGSIGGWLARRG